ncbi:MAG TPA: hypothetical protein VGB37_00530 [Candidatus Lokiarchaeia archaeon]
MKPINEKIIKISGSVSVPLNTEIEISEDKAILIKGACVKTEDRDNNDGTINKVYVIKAITGEIQ